MKFTLPPQRENFRILQFPIPYFATVVAGTWIASSNVNHYMGMYSNTTSHAQNDEFSISVFLPKGTYTLRSVYFTSSSSGIVTIYKDGVSVGSIDCYTAGNVFNNVNDITIVSLTDTNYIFNFKVTDKNAASSSYYLYLNEIIFIRTA